MVKRRNGLAFSQLGGSPSPPPKHHHQNSLRLVSINMASGNVGPQWAFSRQGNQNQHDLRRKLIETLLLESEADVVCVQESIVKSLEWGESRTLGASNSSSPPSFAKAMVMNATSGDAIARLRSQYYQDKKPNVGFPSKAATTTISANDSSTLLLLLPSSQDQSSLDRSSSTTASSLTSSTVFTRSKETALTHCGQTFLYYNKNACSLICEGKISADTSCPEFPVIAIEKKRTNQMSNDGTLINNIGSDGQQQNQQKPQRIIFLVCSIHLAPFPQQNRTRQVQFSKILSELDRLEKVWRLSSPTSSSSPSATSCVYKIIAGDTNMMNDQFPNKESCGQVVDCWYDFKFQTQFPPAEAFRDVVDGKSELTSTTTKNTNNNGVISNSILVPKFFRDSYTFGGDNDFNQGGTRELKRFQNGKPPFFMRYDRVFIVKKNHQRDQENIEQGQQQQQQQLRVSHMQRVFDERIVINGGADSENGGDRWSHEHKEERIGNEIVKDLPGRYLSDHFGLLVDFTF